EHARRPVEYEDPVAGRGQLRRHRTGTTGKVEHRAGRRPQQPGQRGRRGTGTRPTTAGRVVPDGLGVVVAGHTRRRSAAQRDNSYRLDIWSLRSTFDTCVSTVLIEMNSSFAISLYA